MLDLSQYTEDHRAELERLWSSDGWQAVRASGLLEEVRQRRPELGSTRDFIGAVVDQLLEFNEGAVSAAIEAGEADEGRLFVQLSRWPAGLGGRCLEISFLGFNLSYKCNFDPRCIYCNQPHIPATVDIDEFKRIVEESTDSAGDRGPYVYITGGEPLLLEEKVWGDDGLVAFATGRGCAVNVNTNASLMTPEAALRLIGCGLGKLHISYDTTDAVMQDDMWGGGGHVQRVQEGIHNVQLAREAVGAAHPVIHINCVLTRRNAPMLPQLVADLLRKRKQVYDRKQPLFDDLFFHVIPVGGAENTELWLSEDEWTRFYEETWPAVVFVWDEHQAELGIAPEDRMGLGGPFNSPYLRVDHRGGLPALASNAAHGRYGELALSDYCYVAPTQSSFTPDGQQFRCGSHAVRRILPIGTVDGDFHDNIRRGVDDLEQLPNPESCYGCAMATLYINQTVQARLRKKLEEMLAPHAETSGEHAA